MFGTGSTLLTVVNTKNKVDSDLNRQAIIIFGTGNLPTFDTDTYYYSVNKSVIWRIKRVFVKGENFVASYYQPVGKHKQENVSE